MVGHTPKGLSIIAVAYLNRIEFQLEEEMIVGQCIGTLMSNLAL